MIAQERFHSLDAARAMALLFGIVLHATISFSASWVSTGTPVADVSQSATLEGVFHVLHSFRMLLFFLIAGFFGNLLLQHRGTREFWRNRLRRIAVPLVVGWVTLLPLLAAPIVLAVYIQNGGFPGDGRGLAMIREAGVPLGHLWFLYYLLLFYVAVVGIASLLRRLGWSTQLGRIADICVDWLVRRHAIALVMPFPVSLALFFTPDWMPWTGIPSPILGLVPQCAAVVAFGSAFLIGWMLYRKPDLLQVWARIWPLHTALGVAAIAVSLWLLERAGDKNELSDSTERLTYLLCYTFGGWSLALAITGFCIRHLAEYSRTWRYLADASYWMYLIHMPLILLLQVAVMRWPVHWSIKFPLVVAVAFTLLLASYEYLVRYTFVGHWLNGSRHLRR